MDNQQAVYTVYLSYSLDGRMYIGSAKNIKPDYFGSFTDKTFEPIGRVDLLTYDNWEEALQTEELFLRELDAKKSPKFVNNSITQGGQLGCVTPEARAHKKRVLKEYYSSKEGKEMAAKRAKKTAATRRADGSYVFFDNKDFIEKQRVARLLSIYYRGTVGRNKVSKEVHERIREELTERGYFLVTSPVHT